MEAVDFATTLWLADSLQVKHADLVRKSKVHHVGLHRLELTVLNDELELLLWLECPCVGHQVRHIQDGAGRLVCLKQLLFRNVDEVRHELQSVRVNFGLLTLLKGDFLLVALDHHLGELLNQVDVGFEPLLYTDLQVVELLLHHCLQLAPALDIADAHGVLQVGDQRVLIDYLLVPLDEHLGVVQVFGSVDVIFA